MSEDVWILGIGMTKFGKHPDKDLVDLAAEAVGSALSDAGVTTSTRRALSIRWSKAQAAMAWIVLPKPISSASKARSVKAR